MILSIFVDLNNVYLNKGSSKNAEPFVAERYKILKISRRK